MARSIDISGLVFKPPLRHLEAMTASSRLFCFGLGYSALRLARRLMAQGWTVAGTTRSEDSAEKLRQLGIDAYLFQDGRPLSDPASALAGATHLLTSIKPEEGIDPVLSVHEADILAARDLQWVGYLSTTGVYGNTNGGCVSEESPVNPTSDRNRWRVEAEARWLDLQRARDLPVHVFRLAGIYGPGRNQFVSLAKGRARRLIREGQVFSRIHVDDIGGAVMASMAQPQPGRTYNVCDDLPENPAVVVEYAAKLQGVTPPPLVPFEEAELSPMARSFYLDNRRVSNERLRQELGYDFAYPTYKEGLTALLAEMSDN
ncbi:SDR family oxidoreductase [Rhodovibrionaceae bacterium A322]